MFELKPLGYAIRSHIGGGTPPRQVPTYWNGGIPWASVKDFYDDEDQICFTQETISQLGLKCSASNLIPTGTPLICTRMAVGRAAIATMPTAINQDVKALFPGAGIVPEYLIALLNYTRPLAEAQSVGSTVKGIGIEEYLAIPVPIAPTADQTKIAEIIAMINTTINKTEAIIEKLKQVKQGLLNDLLTRGVDANGELRPSFEVAPSLYQNSPLGWIPKEWSLIPLGCIAKVNRGKFTHRPRNDPRFYGGAHPFIQTGDVAAAEGDFVSSFSQTLSDRGVTVSQEFPAGTIAITIAANIADTAILATPMYFPDSVVGAILAPQYNIRFIELTIRRAKRKLDARASQSAQKNINLQDLRPLLVPVPDISEQNEIASKYEALNLRIRHELETLRKFRQQKFALMDDLLTGRVRVTQLLAP